MIRVVYRNVVNSLFLVNNIKWDLNSVSKFIWETFKRTMTIRFTENVYKVNINITFLISPTTETSLLLSTQ